MFRHIYIFCFFREATSRMKEGEEEKTKSYSALIWTQKPITQADLGFFEDIKVSSFLSSLLYQ